MQISMLITELSSILSVLVKPHKPTTIMISIEF